jgi:hypothetical protein
MYLFIYLSKLNKEIIENWFTILNKIINLGKFFLMLYWKAIKINIDIGLNLKCKRARNIL